MSASFFDWSDGGATAGTGATEAAASDFLSLFSNAAFSSFQIWDWDWNAMTCNCACFSSSCIRAMSGALAAASFKSAICFLSTAFSARNAASASGLAMSVCMRDCNA